MSARARLRLTAGSLLAVAIAWFGWRFAAASGARMDLYLLANLLVCLDATDLVVRLWLRKSNLGPGLERTPASTSVPLAIERFAPFQVRLHVRPYALIASLHDAEETVGEFLEAFAPYRDRLWVIDDGSTDDTWFLLQRSGIRCIRNSRNRGKPGAIKELLAVLPPEIETVVVLDPDVRILESEKSGVRDLERVVFEFQRSGMGALCPRIVLHDDRGFTRLQQFEYCLALSVGRKSLGDHTITSGVAIYRRDALVRALDEHTLSVYAEDLRNALLLLERGERIYYDERLVVETDGKRTVKDWFSQRVGWHYGLLRVYRENLSAIVSIAGDRFAHTYQFVVYLGFFSLLFHGFKILSLGLFLLSVTSGLVRSLDLDWLPHVGGLYFLSAYLNYTVLASVALFVAVPRKERSRLLPVVPVYFLYVLLHVVPATLGYANWFSLKLWGRRLYRDGFQTEESLRAEQRAAPA